MKHIGFAGGCFWGVEAYFKIVQGVIKTRVGYAGGFKDFPTYRPVCSGKTGHTETCTVAYDSSLTDLETLLEHFFFIIDPTELNRQGHDEGTQYRTAVFYYDIEDKEIIYDYIDSIRDEYDEDIVVEVLPIMKFWDAEEYHQDYLDVNPGSYCHIDNKKFMCASKIDTLSYLKKKAKKASEAKALKTEQKLKEANEIKEREQKFENFKEDNYAYNNSNNSNDYLGNNFVYQKKRPKPNNYKFMDDSEEEDQEDQEDKEEIEENDEDLVIDFKSGVTYTINNDKGEEFYKKENSNVNADAYAYAYNNGIDTKLKLIIETGNTRVTAYDYTEEIDEDRETEFQENIVKDREDRDQK
jgi:peptide-methionine (S)-S-oxide reductase